MKKSIKNTIKTLAIGAVAVPCALMLTACGGNGNIKVDTKGDYQDTTVAEASTYFEGIQTAEKWDFSGLKFTAKMFIDMSAMESGTAGMGMTMDMTLNGVVNYADDILAKCDTTTKAKITVGDKTQEQTAKGNVYIKDGYVYTNSGELKVKMPIEESDGPEDVTNVIPSTEIVNQYWDQIENATGATIKVATKGTTVKYQLAAEIMEGQTIEMYLIFEDGQFTAFKLNAEMKGSNNEVIYSITMDAIATNETVNITENLDAYIDASEISGTIVG